MKNIEILQKATPEQLGGFLCDLIEDCDNCPTFIFERCKNEIGFSKWLKEEDWFGFEDND